MTKYVVVLTVLALGIMLAPRQALAQGGPGGRFPSFNDLDKNHDGKITSDEFPGPPQFFDRVDTNGDGSITKDEMDAAVQSFRSRMDRRGNFDPAQMKERLLEAHKEALGATDEEWKAIQPLVEKVLDARQKLRSVEGNPFGRGFRRDSQQTRSGRSGGGRFGAPAPEVVALQKTLDDPNASQAEIKSKLAALRQARSEADKALASAQSALRDVLTVKQEAALVLMGTLE